MNKRKPLRAPSYDDLIPLADATWHDRPVTLAASGCVIVGRLAPERVARAHRMILEGLRAQEKEVMRIDSTDLDAEVVGPRVGVPALHVAR